MHSYQHRPYLRSHLELQYLEFDYHEVLYRAGGGGSKGAQTLPLGSRDRSHEIPASWLHH